MAIKLNTSYSKKLGLPGYSSHAFSASVEVELADINHVNAECARLYGLLQASVDGEIRHTGFVPDAAYGKNGTRNGSHRSGRNGNARNGGAPRHTYPASARQRDLIGKVAGENGIGADELAGMAQQHGGAPLAELDKNGASALIDALFARAEGAAPAIAG